MKFLRRHNLKKVFLVSLALVIVFGIFLWGITYFSYRKYYIAGNQFINYVVSKVKEAYPNVSEEDLVLKLNEGRPEKAQEVLKMYGLSTKRRPFLKNYEEIYTEQLLIVSFTFGAFFICLVSAYFIDSYFKNKEIREVIKTLSRVNAGIYDLKLEEYFEGDLAVLKEEVYKTTLVLREKAEQSIKGKNDLKDSIANISHQLKTPLTSILVMVDNLITENVQKDMQKEFLEDIRKQTEYMNFLIVALLKLSRFDADVVVFKKEMINVKELILTVFKKIEPLVIKKDVKIHISGKTDVNFWGDFNWETEAITNIVKNSVEYTEEGKNIYIEFVDTSFYTKIVIKDEGEGMDQKTVRRVFERFFKANEKSQSIGIGLALSKEIIEKDNGSINVKSNKGEGTTFIIKYFK